MLKILKDIAQHTLFKVFLSIFLFAFIGALLVTFFEGQINEEFYWLGDAIWWVLVTMTTVGYGDKVPITLGGRIVGIFIMFFGVALLSIFTATISSIFITRQIKEGKGLEEIKLKDHIIICGWNFSAEQILTYMQNERKPVGPIVLINQLSEDAISDIINQFADLKIKFVRGDYTKETILSRANLKMARSAIILPESGVGLSTLSDERTILATLSIKAINPKIKLFAHLIDRENISHIRKAKVDDVLISDAYSGYLLATHVLYPGIPQTIDQLFSRDAMYTMNRMAIPNQYHNNAYDKLKKFMETEHRTICIGLGREEEGVNLAAILSDDYSFLDKFIKRKFEEAGRGISEESKINIRINPAPDTIVQEKDFLIVISQRETK